MAGMSLSTGLISGMDTGALIKQLMAVEANPQTLLKQQMAATQADAAAYRAVNTRFDALRTAAAALQDDRAWKATTATSSSTAVTATTTTGGTGATAGSVTFTVDRPSATHSVISTTEWPGSTTAFGLGTSMTVAGKAVTFAANATLDDVIATINKTAGIGVTASAISVGGGKVRLQLTAAASGAAAAFSVTGTSDSFPALTVGQDAKVTVGTGPGAFAVTSPTNEFTGLLPGTTITLGSGASGSVTVGLASDPAAVASKVSTLVDAANSLLSAISSYTDADSTSAVLKGDSTLRSLAAQVLDTVATAVGGTSAAVAGLQLTKDGTFAFDKATFLAELKTDPTLVKGLFVGPRGAGTDGIAGNADDVPGTTGVADQLQALAKRASDATTGTLTLLAKSSDTNATDMQDRIADWDVRLALREKTLTRQFTAMETALGTLQNQASWLSSQIASLPSWSKSAKS